MRKIASLVLSAVFMLVAMSMLAAMGCGPKVKTWRPRGAHAYLDIQGKKVLIMPLEVRMPGDAVAMEGALLGGLVNAFGLDGFPLQPAQPALEKIGLGSLTWKLAYGMQHAAFVHNKAEWDSREGEDYSMVPEMVAKLINKAAVLLGKPDIEFDYILVGTINSMGAGTIPRTAKYRVVGGLYDITNKTIAMVFDFEKTTAEDALVAEMVALGGKLIEVIQGELPADLKKR